MRVIRSALLPTAPGYLGYSLLGLLIAVLWQSMGALSAALVLLPLFVARWAIGQYAAEQAAYEATIRALVQAVETKDPYTRGHSERVATASVMIAGVLGMRDERVNALRYAGVLHDVGKLGVPTKILHKTSGLHRRRVRRDQGPPGPRHRDAPGHRVPRRGVPGDPPPPRAHGRPRLPDGPRRPGHPRVRPRHRRRRRLRLDDLDPLLPRSAPASRRPSRSSSAARAPSSTRSWWRRSSCAANPRGGRRRRSPSPPPEAGGRRRPDAAAAAHPPGRHGRVGSPTAASTTTTRLGGGR